MASASSSARPSSRASLSARPSARATPTPTKVAASPVAVNRTSGPPTNSVSKGHANHGAKAWDSPGGMAEQRGRDPSMCAAAQLSNQGLAGSANGAKGANGQDNQAHAGGQGAILNTRTASSGRSMGSEAGGVSVVSGNMSGTRHIKGLKINQSMGERAIKARQHNVRRFTQAGTRALHPSIQGSMPPHPTPLSNHTGSTKDSIKEGNERLNSRVMAVTV